MIGRHSIFVILLIAMANPAFAGDNEELNDMYRHFFSAPVDVEKIEGLYNDDIIHVSRPNTALIRGRKSFMETNILPLTEMVNSGQIEISGKAYIVRRVIRDNMANDVGYLHMRMKQADGEPFEQLQKFSWVFVREDDGWRILTDFDATPAPVELVKGLQAEFVVD